MIEMRASKLDEPQKGVMAESWRLLRPFTGLGLFGAVAGILSGMATAWLLALINRAVFRPDAWGWQLALAFGGLCLLSAGGTAVAGSINSLVGQKLIASLRKDISARILRAPIATLEARRAYRLMAVLTSDVDTVSVFTFNMSGYAIALAITIGGLAYLWLLSPAIFLLAVAALGVGVAINIVAKRGWIRAYQKVRVAQDELHAQYRAIIDGAKELKISRPRRARTHGLLLSGAADRIATAKSRAMHLFWLADAAGAALFFIVIGGLLAGKGLIGIDGSAISGTIIVLLYLKAPVAQLAAALPAFAQARISFRRIAELSIDFAQHEPNLALNVPLGVERSHAAIRRLVLEGVRYAFPEDQGAFALGPIDLEINAGELLFIVGENGSGKTTLIKLLLGLYAPQEGQILLDGVPVTPERRDDYRQLFTTIFADYYLFEDLAQEALPDRARPYLERLGIAHKVQLDGHRFSTTDLSTGQRKRLALAQAYLEDRPIIVTDEWAADQDPAFRRVFYEGLLAELKARGKTLIMISHDDRYFHVADRIIRMADGRIIEDRRP